MLTATRSEVVPKARCGVDPALRSLTGACYAPCARANDTRCATAPYGARDAAADGAREFAFDRVFGEFASARHSALDLGFYGMGDQHALCALDALEDGGFVDGATSDVTLRVLAYNAASGQAGLWALLRVRFRFGAHDESDVDAARGGGSAAARGPAREALEGGAGFVAKERRVEVFALRPMYRSAADARRLAVELLLLLLTGVVAGAEALQALRNGLRAHFESAWNWFDLLKVCSLGLVLSLFRAARSRMKLSAPLFPAPAPPPLSLSRDRCSASSRCSRSGARS